MQLRVTSFEFVACGDAGVAVGAVAGAVEAVVAGAVASCALTGLAASKEAEASVQKTDLSALWLGIGIIPCG
jgi:hypothetical protein